MEEGRESLTKGRSISEFTDTDGQTYGRTDKRTGRTTHLNDHTKCPVGEFVNFRHLPEKLFRFVERNMLKGLFVDFDHKKLLGS